MRYIKKGKERTKEDARALRSAVSEIIENVQENGDKALFEYSARFDGFVRDSLRVSEEEIAAAVAQLTPEETSDLKEALEQFEAVQEDIRILSGYYESPQWREDLEADEAHLLPVDLPRGVLSEDGIYNVLGKNEELKQQLK